MPRLKTVLGWVWGITAPLLMIGALSDHLYLAALNLAVSGLVALPPLWKFGPSVVPGKAWFWIGLAAALMGFALIGADAPSSDTAGKTSSSVAAKAEPKAAPIAPAKAVDAKGDLLAAYRQLLGSVKDCDTANTRFADYVGRAAQGNGTPYEAYQLAKSAHGICEDVSSEVGGIKTPDSFNAEQRNEFESAIDKCQKAYLFRTGALETAMTVFDGDSRPSKVSEFTDSAKTAQLGIVLCVAGLQGLGEKVGAKPKDFQ